MDLRLYYMTMTMSFECKGCGKPFASFSMGKACPDCGNFATRMIQHYSSREASNE